MTTERDYPTITLRVQLAPRGDVRWTLEEGAAPFTPPAPGDWGGWCEPDELWLRLRPELPVALATWLHRLRRSQSADNPLPPL